MLVRDCIRAFSQREDEETVKLCRPNSAAFQAGLEYAVKEKLQIELLRVTVSETKLFSGFSLNDHMGLYITVLTERRGSITTAVREAENRLNMNELTGRRDDTSLQGTVTITAAAKKAEEEEDVIMRAVILQLIDTTVSAFNLAFLMGMEAAAAPQRYLLLTRKH
ncbi:hypothetical protein BDDG_13034 [Blastomyces dermatitidis ATCC 18188]|uniref:Uncharacterized protein n=1 Tax=Ajellomyces dermatitidis (strain ATCC 18188 / CBS 674.68) TaxID=653446 RepID=A0A0J9ERX7_AJEDA|nr:hypothetical protein BDDG_13034 [Blastomyces dermatitidis ATCC 18188]